VHPFHPSSLLEGGRKGSFPPPLKEGRAPFLLPPRGRKEGPSSTSTVIYKKENRSTRETTEVNLNGDLQKRKQERERTTAAVTADTRRRKEPRQTQW
jgi:hypothetical protein